MPVLLPTLDPRSPSVRYNTGTRMIIAHLRLTFEYVSEYLLHRPSLVSGSDSPTFHRLIDVVDQACVKRNTAYFLPPRSKHRI